jgi:hypothetical protein
MPFLFTETLHAIVPFLGLGRLTQLRAASKACRSEANGYWWVLAVRHVIHPDIKGISQGVLDTFCRDLIVGYLQSLHPDASAETDRLLYEVIGTVWRENYCLFCKEATLQTMGDLLCYSIRSKVKNSCTLSQLLGTRAGRHELKRSLNMLRSDLVKRLGKRGKRDDLRRRSMTAAIFVMECQLKSEFVVRGTRVTM